MHALHVKIVATPLVSHAKLVISKHLLRLESHALSDCLDSGCQIWH